MSTTAVGHCDLCAAVVNRRWARCLVCHAPLPPPHAPNDPTLRPGDWIEWHREGTVQYAVVDFIHVAGDGIAWAFVSMGENWSSVNLKFATVQPVP
jgi:hypothetical protein